MSETPEQSTQPTSAAAAPPPPPPPQRLKPPMLYTAAAWVVIVAGIVFILSVVFFSGAMVFGHHYHCHHQHGTMFKTRAGPRTVAVRRTRGPRTRERTVAPVRRTWRPRVDRSHAPRRSRWPGCRPWSRRPRPVADDQCSEPSSQHTGAASLAAASRRMQHCLTFLDLIQKGGILSCMREGARDVCQRAERVWRADKFDQHDIRLHPEVLRAVRTACPRISWSQPS